MKLQNSNGEWFELTFMGYQFPGTTDNNWDANWLVVEGRISLSRCSWSFKDPCLLVSEAIELADWMTKLSEGSFEENQIGFVEPNLKFEVLNYGWEKTAVRVHFSHEAKPQMWRYTDADCWFEAEVDPTCLAEAAESLRSDLLRFPVRDAEERWSSL